MDRPFKTDFVLPLSFNESSSAIPEHLQETTLVNHDSTFFDTTTAQKPGSGRMSPVRARTMKEYEQQIEKLTKENFSLKLRIYYLEEGAEKREPGTADSTYKTNVELMIKVESLKKDVLDKQELLKKARAAMDSLSTQHATELEEAQARTRDLQTQLHAARQDQERLASDLEESSRKVNELVQLNNTLDTAYRQALAASQSLTATQRASNTSNHTGSHAETQTAAEAAAYTPFRSSMDEQLSLLRSQLEYKDREIQDLEEEMALFRDKLLTTRAEYASNRVELSSARAELSSARDEFSSALAELTTTRAELTSARAEVEQERAERVAEVTSRVQERQRLTKLADTLQENIKTLERKIQDKNKEIQTLEERAAGLQGEVSTHAQNALKRDKAIQGLASALLAKEEQLTQLEEQLKDSRSQLQDTKNQLESAENQLDDANHQLEVAETQLEDTKQQLDEAHNQLETTENQLAATRRQIESTSGQLESRSHQLDASKRQLEAINGQLEAAKRKLEAANRQLESKVHKLENELADMETRLTEAETRASELEGCESELSRVSAKLQARDSQMADRDQEISSLRQQVALLQQEVEESSVRSRGEGQDTSLAQESGAGQDASLVQGLKQQMEQLRNQNHRLRADSVDREAEVDGLREELESVQRVLGKRNQVIQEKDRQLDECMALLEQHQPVAEQQKRHMEELKRQLHDQQRALQAVSNDDPLVSRAHAHQVGQLREEVTSLQMQLSQLQKQLQSAKAQLQDRDAKMKALQEESAQQQQTVSSLEASVARQQTQLQRGEEQVATERAEQQHVSERMRLALQSRDVTVAALQRQLAAQSGTTGDPTRILELENLVASLQAQLNTALSQPINARQSLANQNGGVPGTPSVDVTRLGDSSYLPSYLQLPPWKQQLNETQLPDDSQLDSMSRDEMQQLIGGLRAEMMLAQDSETCSQLSASNTVDQQLSDLEAQLLAAERDRAHMAAQLELVLYGPTSDRDIRIIPLLKQQLQEARAAAAASHRQGADLSLPEPPRPRVYTVDQSASTEPEPAHHMTSPLDVTSSDRMTSSHPVTSSIPVTSSLSLTSSKPVTSSQPIGLERELAELRSQLKTSESARRQLARELQCARDMLQNKDGGEQNGGTSGVGGGHSQSGVNKDSNRDRKSGEKQNGGIYGNVSHGHGGANKDNNRDQKGGEKQNGGASGADAELLHQMALEIERLRAALAAHAQKQKPEMSANGSAADSAMATERGGNQRQRADGFREEPTSDGSVPRIGSETGSSSDEASAHALRKQTTGRSLIPKRQQGDAPRDPALNQSEARALGDQLRLVQEQLANTKAENADLAAKLVSTEATVRQQTDKMKQYRSQLVDNGLLPPHPRSPSPSTNGATGPLRARSPSPATRGPAPSAHVSRRASPTPRGVSPIPGGAFSSTGGASPSPGRVSPVSGGVSAIPRGTSPIPCGRSPSPGLSVYHSEVKVTVGGADDKKKHGGSGVQKQPISAASQNEAVGAKQPGFDSKNRDGNTTNVNNGKQGVIGPNQGGSGAEISKHQHHQQQKSAGKPSGGHFEPQVSSSSSQLPLTDLSPGLGNPALSDNTIQKDISGKKPQPQQQYSVRFDLLSSGKSASLTDSKTGSKPAQSENMAAQSELVFTNDSIHFPDIDFSDLTDGTGNLAGLRKSGGEPALSAAAKSIVHCVDFGQSALIVQLRSEVNDLKQKLGTCHRLNQRLQLQLKERESTQAGQGEDFEREPVHDTDEQPGDQLNTTGLTDMASFYKFKAANERAFARLQGEVGILRGKLRLFDTLNASVATASLATNVDQSEIEELRRQCEAIMKDLANENIGLGAQLGESRAHCAVLGGHLESLSQALQSLLRFDVRSGTLDVLNLSASAVGDIERRLKECRDMTSNLAVSLKLSDGSNETLSATTPRNIAVRHLSTGFEGAEEPSHDLDTSYQNACEQIQKLELQLSRRANFNELNTSRRLADTESELEELKSLNSQLNNKLKQMQLQLAAHDQEKALAKQRSTSLQQEVNRLRREYLTLKEGLNSEQSNTARYVDQINNLHKDLARIQQTQESTETALARERETCSCLKADKEQLNWKVQRLSAERAQLSADKQAMHEQILQLENLLAQCKEECNALLVRQAGQQALVFQHETAADRLGKALGDKEELVAKLKQLVKDNQNTTEQLSAELQAMSEEVEDKTNTVAQLRSKLKQLQAQYSIPVSDLSLDDEADDSSPERPRWAEVSSKQADRSVVTPVVNGSHVTGEEEGDEAAQRLQRDVYMLQGQLQAERELVHTLRGQLDHVGLSNGDLAHTGTLKSHSVSRSRSALGHLHSPPTRLSERSQSADTTTNGDKPSAVLNGSASPRSPRRSTPRLPASKYNVSDAHRPPTSVSTRVSADVRTLYAVGTLDDYELMRTQLERAHTQLTSLERKVKARLAASKHVQPQDSADYALWRELEECNAQTGEAHRLVGRFWLSQLPVRDEITGAFVDTQLLDENLQLSGELARYKKEYSKIKHKLSQANRTLDRAAKLRETAYQETLKQLSGHHSNLGRTKWNLNEYGSNLIGGERSQSPTIYS